MPDERTRDERPWTGFLRDEESRPGSAADGPGASAEESFEGSRGSSLLSLGQVGSYRILEVLGEVGMATVYLAKQAPWSCRRTPSDRTTSRWR